MARLLMTLVLFATPAFADELEDILAETEQAKSEVERLETQVAKEEKTLADQQSQIERLKLELQTLTELRNEKSQRLSQIAAEKDRMSLELKELEAKRAQAEQEFNQVKEREKLAEQEHEQSKLEHAQKKAHIDAEIAELKPAAPAEPVLAAAPREPASASDDSLTLTRKCRVFDRPGKGSSVLAAQERGTSITKLREGRTWVSFSLSDGREGYLGKQCFK